MNTLEITTMIGCTNYCNFCPQDTLMDRYEGERVLNIFNFLKILDNTPKDVIIDFTGFCEPFLNPLASAMMRATILRGYKTYLITTLSGFDEKDIKILRRLRFEHLWIHEYPGYEGSEYIEELKTLTDDFKQFKIGEIYSRAGNVWQTLKKEGKLRCGWNENYTRNVVLPNGDVYLCCMDYSLKHKLGNLLDTNYNNLNREGIFNLADNPESNLLCRNCEIAKYVN
jgi:radical SAM protein with 4Fe4S-binding SPASM domain